MRKAVIAIVFAFAILLIFLGGELSLSFFHRWQASKLLAVVRQFQPGITTEAQARSGLKPFARYETEDAPASGDVKAVALSLENSPPFPWTRFSVQIDFVGGLISEINALEMQVDKPGYPHPNSASVTEYSNRLHPLPPDFTGYSESSRTTGGVDTEGRWTGFICCHAREIRLDERATPAQLSRSLNFRLSCMTSFTHCKDDRQILP